MKSWTPCRAFESILLMGLLGFLLHHNTTFTNAQNQRAEEIIFMRGYEDSGIISFIDYKRDFCKFMRPIGFIYRERSFVPSAIIDLPSLNRTCRADIVTCHYIETFVEDACVVDYNYAQGPDGKYYKMIASTWTSRWEIDGRVRRPYEDYEKLFYNEYVENRGNPIKFSIPTENFCHLRTPAYAMSHGASVLQEKLIEMIEFEAGSPIKVEVCHCKFNLPFGGDEDAFYAQSSDGQYFEVRSWNFQIDYLRDKWVIWGKADVHQ